MTDIFDMTDLSDIPETIKNDVEDVVENNIIELFNIAKRKLHIDEVTVAYYRKFGGEFTKTQMRTKLYNMSRKRTALIKPTIGKGFYKLNDKNN